MARKLDFVALILLVFLLLKKVLSASSYGHFTATKEFWSQCHIFRGYYSEKVNLEFRKMVPGAQYPVAVPQVSGQYPAGCARRLWRALGPVYV